MINPSDMLKKRPREGGPVRVAVIGAGPLSSRIAAQITAGLPEITLVGVADDSLPAARKVVAEAGLRIPRVIESAFGLNAALKSGEAAVTGNWRLLCESPLIDAVIEATGQPERAAEIVSAAEARGKHVISTTASGALASAREASARIELVQLGVDAAVLPDSLGMSRQSSQPASDNNSRASAQP